MKNIYDKFTKEWIEVSDNDFEEMKNSEYWGKRYSESKSCDYLNIDGLKII